MEAGVTLEASKRLETGAAMAREYTKELEEKTAAARELAKKAGETLKKVLMPCAAYSAWSSTGKISL